MKRSFTFGAVLAVGALTLVGCGTSTGDTSAPTTADPTGAVQFPLTFDNCGTKVTIQSRPERVLTIGTPAVDALYAAGASDRVVARAGEYDVPATGPAGAAVASKPVIDPMQPTLESIIGSNADIVIGYGLGKTTADDLTQAGISHYILSGYCGSTESGTGTGDGAQVQDLYTDQEFLGGIFGTQQKANQAAADLKKRVDAVQLGKPAGNRSTAAAIYFLGEQTYTYGEKAMITDEMRVLGLTNLLAKVDQSVEFNREELIAANPDVIIIIYGYEAGDTFDKAKQHFLSLPGVGTMTAVKNNALVGVTGPQAEASPIAVDGIELMARELSGLN